MESNGIFLISGAAEQYTPNGQAFGADLSPQGSMTSDSSYASQLSLQARADYVLAEQQCRISNLEEQLTKARQEILQLREHVRVNEEQKSKVRDYREETKKKAQSRYWTPEEHQRFLEGVRMYGPKDVKSIANYVSSRSATQVRTHAQKYWLKLQRDAKKKDHDKNGADDLSDLGFFSDSDSMSSFSVTPRHGSQTPSLSASLGSPSAAELLRKSLHVAIPEPEDLFSPPSSMTVPTVHSSLPNTPRSKRRAKQVNVCDSPRTPKRIASGLATPNSPSSPSSGFRSLSLSVTNSSSLLSGRTTGASLFSLNLNSTSVSNPLSPRNDLDMTLKSSSSAMATSSPGAALITQALQVVAQQSHPQAQFDLLAGNTPLPSNGHHTRSAGHRPVHNHGTRSADKLRNVQGLPPIGQNSKPMDIKTMRQDSMYIKTEMESSHSSSEGPEDAQPSLLPYPMSPSGWESLSPLGSPARDLDHDELSTWLTDDAAPMKKEQDDVDMHSDFVFDQDCRVAFA
eukprot:GILK01004055.1.p1 GENE.GILK01004055.1~~GILK01004055.1.p1  ORF type:complete len:512 (+),score=77.08 GILK01004055.1:133-1668(+)